MCSSWRDVIATISAPGCRRRSLISSTAVYPDPPRIATFTLSIALPFPLLPV